MFAAVDATDQMLLIASALHELEKGVQTTSQMRTLSESGMFCVPTMLVIDAQGVYQSLKAQTGKIPTEKSLAIQVFWLRELIERGRVRFVCWVDTRDMHSDGLTKGSVDRAALQQVMSGKFVMTQPCLCFTKHKATV